MIVPTEMFNWRPIGAAAVRMLENECVASRCYEGVVGARRRAGVQAEEASPQGGLDGRAPRLTMKLRREASLFRLGIFSVSRNVVSDSQRFGIFGETKALQHLQLTRQSGCERR